MDAARRPATLDRSEVVGALDAPAFDAITAVVARTLDVPIAMIGFVDGDRQWFESCVGLDARETPRVTAFCDHAIQSDDPLVVPDATADARFATNPLVTGPPHVRSYAGVPLIAPDGARIGALSALDRRPRVPTASELATLRDLAGVVVALLEQRSSARERRILAAIAEVSPNGAFCYDVQQQRLLWSSPGLERLVGTDPAAWRATIASDDLERLDRYLLGPSDPPEVVPFRLRASADRGERSLVVRRAAFERDDDGAVRSVIGIIMDVTDLRLADDRLRRSERELADRVLVLEAILESAGEGILFADSSGRLQLANTKARALRNHTAARVGDEAFVQTAGLFEQDQVTPLRPARLPMARALGGEVVERQRLWIRNASYPDGVHVQSNARPIVDAQGNLRGAVATIADVTELERARAGTARALDNLTAIIGTLPIGLCVGRGERIIYANAALARMLDRDLSSLVGVSILDLVVPEDRDLVRRRLAILQDGGENAPVELSLQGRHGPVPVEANGLTIEHDGGEAVLVICRDVTQETRARAQIDASLREKEALLKEIHHRVKNNLSVVASLLYMQARSSADPVVRATLEQSMARVHSIGLVHDQLYKTKDFARVDLGTYLQTLAHELSATTAAPDRGIAIEVRAQPVTVDLDQAMPCGLIVNELLTNALKHAFPHRAGTVVVTVGERAGRVAIAVADDGVGFDRGRALSAGLGLALIDDLCEQLGATTSTGAGSGPTGTSFGFEFARES